VKSGLPRVLQSKGKRKEKRKRKHDTKHGAESIIANIHIANSKNDSNQDSFFLVKLFFCTCLMKKMRKLHNSRFSLNFERRFCIK